MSPPGAPIKLAPDTYDGNTNLEEYLVYFEQLAMFNMWNEPIKAMILGLGVTMRLEKQKFNFKVTLALCETDRNWLMRYFQSQFVTLHLLQKDPKPANEVSEVKLDDQFEALCQDTECLLSDGIKGSQALDMAELESILTG